MGNDIYPLDIFGNPPRNNCECCNPRLVAMTSTYSVHKWTREEIVEEMVYWSNKVVESRFWSRGHAISRLKHWTEKLEKLNELENEFNTSLPTPSLEK